MPEEAEKLKESVKRLTEWQKKMAEAAEEAEKEKGKE